MELGLRSKVVLVTGASRGIGLAIARGFATEGARLAICARGEEPLRAAEASLAALGAEVCAMSVDVTDEEGRRRLLSASQATLGPVDVLVNNVGGGGGPSFLETSAADWDDVLARNLRSGVELARLVVPAMVARRQGVILFVSSIFGREWGGRPAYMTAKAAEVALAKSLARELAPHGVRVNSVAPGSILFPGGSWDRRRQDDPERIARFVEAELPLGRFGTPEEVADAVVFLASERASLVTGVCLNVDGGQSRSLI